MNYDLLAADYAAHRRVHPAIMAKLLEAVDTWHPETIVDIGCGTGNYAAAMQEAAGSAGACVLGVEPSYGMVAYAQARGLKVCQGQAEAIPLATAAVDLLFSVDVVHHVRAVPEYFAEARRVLRANGRFCIATDSERILATRYPLATYWPETIASEMERYHSISKLREWLETAGFQGLRDEEVEFAYLLHDAELYRRRAYSTLQRISDEVWRRGLAQLEADLERGPLACTSRYTLVWGEVPAA